MDSTCGKGSKRRRQPCPSQEQSTEEETDGSAEEEQTEEAAVSRVNLRRQAPGAAGDRQGLVATSLLADGKQHGPAVVEERRWASNSGGDTGQSRRARKMTKAGEFLNLSHLVLVSFYWCWIDGVTTGCVRVKKTASGGGL